VRLPTPPSWMADLPRPHHPRAKVFESHPAFAACQWVSGKPILSLDLRKLRILGIRGRCWLCGYPVVGTGFVVVKEEDVTDRYGDLHTQGSGPVHRSCALFSVAVCPFLKYPQSRRRITGTGLRGTASIKGFSQYAVVFPPDPTVFMSFGFYAPTETIAIRNQTQVAELYERALNADAATNFTATPRLYWTDGPDDTHRLRIEWLEEWQQLQAWAETSVVTIDRHTYRGHYVVGSGQPASDPCRKQ
jgi:hypothetical protein